MYSNIGNVGSVMDLRTEPFQRNWFGFGRLFPVLLTFMLFILQLKQPWELSSGERIEGAKLVKDKGTDYFKVYNYLMLFLNKQLKN